MLATNAEDAILELVKKIGNTMLASTTGETTPIFSDTTCRTRLFHWSQYTIADGNAACAAIASVISMTLLCSSRGSVLTYTPSERPGGGSFTIDEAQLLRCTREATEWWLRLIQDDRVIKTPGASSGNYIMPLQCVREHPVLRDILNYEERYGLFDERIDLANSAMCKEFNMITLGTLLVELGKRSANSPIAAVITRGASTSCIFVEPVCNQLLRNYWFIDTHSNNAEGMRESNGSAIVLRFGSLNDICSYMQKLYGNGERVVLEADQRAAEANYETLQTLYNQSHEVGERAAVVSTQFDALILTVKHRPN